jgi:SAM-dependent methyltransferase
LLAQRLLDSAGVQILVDLYGREGLDLYERAHYSREEQIEEIRQILSWYHARGTRLLDIGCSGGLHALEFALRGFSVTGVDIEPFAIDRAQKRSREMKAGARFRVLDLRKDPLSSLGTFDFIYSLGNVLSHIEKESLLDVLKKLRGSLARDGTLLFDLLMKGDRFRTEIRDDDRQILWQRTLEEETGRISMDGHFLEFGFSQHFEVWGYSLEEALGLVEAAGFSPVGVGDRLDFARPPAEGSNPYCLNFRARPKEGG